MSLKHYVKENIWWPVKHRVINPRSAMRAAVFPPKHQSLEDIIVQFHLAAIIELVDVQNCFDDIRYLVTKTPTFTSELRECYEYARIGRAQLLAKIDQAWLAAPEVATIPDDFQPVMELEDELHRYDTEVCCWVVENRGKLFG